jgi:hypothetical protein
MPKKFTITDQETNKAKPVYWEFIGRNVYKEPNPAQKLMKVHNALQTYLQMKQTLLRDAKVGEEYPRARASNVQTLRSSTKNLFTRQRIACVGCSVESLNTLRSRLRTRASLLTWVSGHG